MPDIVRRSGKLERETPKGCATSDFIIRTGLGGAYHLQRVLKLCGIAYADFRGLPSNFLGS